MASKSFFDDEFQLPKLEERVLEFWREKNIFEKSLAKRKGRKEFVFYEGPPYANGRPGIHHVLARAFKDIILRYRTMRGYYVPRRAGWDTHGLPTEIEVEKQLGIKHKKEIEKFGIGLFNQKAKESVWKYKEEWERLSERIGYWLDLKNAYVTYTNDYVETMWWIFRRVADRGFLKENLKVVPYCPRCQTPLASHELAQPGVYKKTKDPSVYIKFEIKKNEYILVWTTTPWTLSANLFIAANPELTYTKYKIGKECFWSYNAPPVAPGIEAEAVEKLSGKKLIGQKYKALYPQKGNTKAYRVIAADFVSTEEGTGFVHIAPAFGEDDFRAVQALGYDMQAIPITIDAEAKIVKGFPGAGKYIKVGDEDVKADLTERKLLYRAETVEHDYPFCWRCGSALVYMARRAWFFEMSRLRGELMKRNETINWVPSHLKEGRFGEWIKEAKDWAISRERYWGMPLPIWRCEKCEEIHVAGDLHDLTAHEYAENTFTFLRHTESEHVVRGVIASGPETGSHISHLTQAGKKAAEKLVAKLKKGSYDAIYASPYLRTKTLAEMIKKKTGAKLYVDERLGEIDSGAFNWQPIAKYRGFFANKNERFTSTPPGGESLNDVRRRTLAAFLDINKKNKDKKILIVSHEDSLWMLKSALLHLSPEAMLAAKRLRPGEAEKISFDNFPVNDFGEIDIHRPYTDEIFLACKKCDGKMERVKEVADVWFDSGAMPFAQNHFPFAQGGEEKGRIQRAIAKLPYPADYICEAIDQTRGWFYTLLAVSTLLDQPASYKNVLCLGLIMDKFGQKMSKSKGNVVDPWMVADKYGVDAVRWYFYTVNPPEESKNFDEQELAKSFRRFHLILYNSFLFYKTYAKQSAGTAAPKTENVLDRWVLSRLNETIVIATRELEKYEIREAALALERFVDDLSRWYIRRSRRRLQRPVSQADFAAVSETLGYVLLALAKLVAPFTPFFGEALYGALAGGKALESVHLADWPEEKKSFADETLIKEMAEVRRFASVGLAERAKLGIKVRQPLQSATIRSEARQFKDKQVLEILAEELNVKEIQFDAKAKEEVVFDTKITAELRAEGVIRELARSVAELRQKADLNPKDKIALFLQLPTELASIVKQNEKFLKDDAGAKTIDYKKTEKFDAELTTKLPEGDVWLAVRKIK